jgi:hypothetical protein
MDTKKAFIQTKKVLGIIAVVATSLIVALDLMNKELGPFCDEVNESSQEED